MNGARLTPNATRTCSESIKNIFRNFFVKRIFKKLFLLFKITLSAIFLIFFEKIDDSKSSKVRQWLSPEQIRWPIHTHSLPLTVFNNPKPGDIIQGELGDCWLVAALSLVAEVPSILFKIMITKDYNTKGMYQIRLCDRGLWKIVVVDDRFPVTENGFFSFTYAKRKQLFASLIEKAFAKLHGNYSALRSGRCDEGLQALTGEPTQVLFLRSSSGSVKKDLNEIWQSMVEAKNKGYLMTCPASNPKLNIETFNRRGIEPNHAYSVMNVISNGSSRHVVLRNPWGGNRLKSRPKAETIRMRFDEMPYFFSSISICKFNPNWTEVRKRGQFNAFSVDFIESCYMLEVKTLMKLEIELFNAGDGVYYNRKNDPDIDLCLVVLRQDGVAIGYNHDVDFYIAFSSDYIQPGMYQVVALSFSTMHHNIYPIYNIAFHGSQNFVVHNYKFRSHQLANIFQKVAISQNRIHPLSNIAHIMTFNDNGNFGMVVENKHSESIKVHSDFHGTKNVLSSRSSLCVDVIPPYSRLLVIFFTRKVYKGNVLISYKSKAQPVKLKEAHQPKLNPNQYALHHAVSIV